MTGRGPRVSLTLGRKIAFIVLVAALSLISGCSGSIDAMIPASLDEKGSTRLVKRLRDAEARALFSGDQTLRDALDEFLPEGMDAGVYDYGGIRIHLGLARFDSADDAYGLYSALVDMPRDRWEFGRGEMSYRSPYFAGCAGEYAFWFVPPGRTTYAAFYRNHGERIIRGIDPLIRKPDRSYHWKILHRENRFVDSLFYVRSRSVSGLRLTDAYGAVYLAGRNTARIYVERHENDASAERAWKARRAALKRKGIDCVNFLPIPGAPMEACHWREPSGVRVLCHYRWLNFFITDVPELTFAKGFLRSMFANMMKIRKEVLGERGDFKK